MVRMEHRHTRVALASMAGRLEETRKLLLGRSV